MLKTTTMKHLLMRVSLLGLATLVSCGGGDKDPDPDSCIDPPMVSVSAVTDASSCGGIDGAITVIGSGGEGALMFSVNGTAFQSSGSFSGLAPDAYTVTVKDQNNCSSTAIATVLAIGTDLSVVGTPQTNTGCQTNESNGAILASASGGTPPYQFSIGGAFAIENEFTSLDDGNYSLSVKDDTGCTITANVTVSRGDTGTSFENDIKPIIDTKCAISGCHNGDNGADKNWTVFSNFQGKASLVKQKTQDGSMPKTGSITEEQKALIACWVDDGAKNN